MKTYLIIGTTTTTVKHKTRKTIETTEAKKEQSIERLYNLGYNVVTLRELPASK